MTQKLYFASEAERCAVLWYKKQKHRGGFIAHALLETAYDPHFSKIDWRRGTEGLGELIPRARWVYWCLKPYGHERMNRDHMRALRCIRRNVYFRDTAKRLQKERAAP